MRTLVIGDIHGGFRALEQLINRAKVVATDTLIFLGDYVDGWSQSPQVINYLLELKTSNKCVFIRGNHDDLLLEWFKKTTDNPMWFKHGGESTLLAYEKQSQETIAKHIAFLESLEDYYLDDFNRLFVHAGFTNANGVSSELFSKMFYWDRTLWEMAVAMDKSIGVDQNTYPTRLTLYHEIFIGHTPVTRIEKTTPIQMANVWNVDTGAAFKGPLSIMDVNTKQFWQSDNLPDLYPEEKGRN